MKNSKLFKNWGLFLKGMDPDSIQLSFANHLEYSLSKDQYTATMRDLYHSLALAVRDRLVERWIQTQQSYYDQDVKRIYYLSAEYLMGRALTNNMINLGMYDEARKAMEEVHLNIEDIAAEEPDMGLGNGGLGRLAACFLDSMATLELPACGYGIRYEFGIFDQHIHKLKQVEKPERWLQDGNPWEFARPERRQTVKFYGRVEEITGPDGELKIKWRDTEKVVGVPYDTPIGGFGNNTVNTLRLWSARASQEFDLQFFQDGDYLKAVEEKNISENISKVLYPNDQFYKGKELRLKQQYFFVSCSIQDILRRHLSCHKDFNTLPDKAAIQMNDTHPSLAVPELMRILMDDHGLSWEAAWDITVRTCAYTNHTLLSEALEKWPLSLMEKLLPRLMMIIYEINRRFLRDVSVVFINDEDRLRRMSLIEEVGEKQVRMAHLALVGSHSVNGVAELHTRLLREQALKDFYEMHPERFTNKTNGVTPRRWLLGANPELARLISRQIGQGWAVDLNELRNLESLADDADFRQDWIGIKYRNKEALAQVVQEIVRLRVNPSSIFDIQVKRIHEYKRQLLNILHLIYCWLKLKESDGFDLHPRTFFFGGKAAPGYFMAKQIIQLICHVAAAVNRDRTTKDALQVIFLPNYRVSLAEKIFPAADVSEQISTAGYEASGTSNMKFSLNGALTIGTLDGANIEIMEEVGQDNIFIFGLTSEEVDSVGQDYNPKHYYEQDPILKKAVDLINNGFFSPDQKDLFHPIVKNLLTQDPYLIMADFASYHKRQMDIDALYRDQEEWVRKSILNVARIGKFSSDRTIREYNRDIWKAEPLTITKEDKTASERRNAS